MLYIETDSQSLFYPIWLTWLQKSALGGHLGPLQETTVTCPFCLVQMNDKRSTVTLEARKAFTSCRLCVSLLHTWPSPEGYGVTVHQTMRQACMCACTDTCTYKKMVAKAHEGSADISLNNRSSSVHRGNI